MRQRSKTMQRDSLKPKHHDLVNSCNLNTVANDYTSIEHHAASTVIEACASLQGGSHRSMRVLRNTFRIETEIHGTIRVFSLTYQRMGTSITTTPVPPTILEYSSYKRDGQSPFSEMRRSHCAPRLSMFMENAAYTRCNQLWSDRASIYHLLVSKT